MADTGSMSDFDNGSGFLHVDPVDIDTMSYFPPSTSTTLALPAPAPRRRYIMTSLLEAAEVEASLYPPKSWDGLKDLVDSIEASNFDTLRRNGLVFYLLLDYHLLPLIEARKESGDHVSPSSSSCGDLLPKSPILKQFVTNRLLPTFWTDTFEKGFWRFDRGFYTEAIPWLNNHNSASFADHIILSLSPFNAGNSLPLIKAADCIIKYLSIARPALPVDNAAVLEAVIASKATVEGLKSALEAVRGSPPQHHTALLTCLWSWLFALRPEQGKHIQPSLLNSLVVLPLTDVEANSITAFALGQTGTQQTYAGLSLSLALDTLLVRLINQGRVVDALRANAVAEQKAHLYVAESSSADYSSAYEMRKRRQRKEMLRLAREMLPEVVAAQVQALSMNEGIDAGIRSGRDGNDGDDDMELVERPDPSASLGGSYASLVPSPKLAPADASMQDDAANRRGSNLLKGYLQKRAAAPAPVSPSASPQPPSALKTSTSSHRNSPTRYATMSGPRRSFGSHAPPPAAAASPSARKSGTRFGPSLSSSGASAAASASGAPAASDSSDEGPYARLAAQLMAQSQASEAGDESLSLSSFIPQKRTISASQRGAETEEMSAPAPEGRSQGSRNAAARSGSPFEPPKRRYTKKAPAEGEAEPATAAPARRGTRGSRLRKSTTMADFQFEPENEPGMDLDLSLDMTVSQPQSVATFPEPAADQGRKAQNASQPSLTKASKDRRSAVAGRKVRAESVPGSFPGLGDEPEEEEMEATAEQQQQEEVNAPPEMTQIGRAPQPLSARRGQAQQEAEAEAEDAGASASKRSKTRRSAAAAKTATTTQPMESTPARKRSSRAAAEKGVGAATRTRRSTRGHSRASSVASSLADGDEEEEEEAREPAPAPAPKARRGSKTRRSSAKSTSASMRKTRSSSVLSQTLSEADEYGEGEDGDEGGETEADTDAQSQAETEQGGEDEGDETPRAEIKVRTRSGRAVKRTSRARG